MSESAQSLRSGHSRNSELCSAPVPCNCMSAMHTHTCQPCLWTQLPIESKTKPPPPHNRRTTPSTIPPSSIAAQEMQLGSLWCAWLQVNGDDDCAMYIGELKYGSLLCSCAASQSKTLASTNWAKCQTRFEAPHCMHGEPGRLCSPLLVGPTTRRRAKPAMPGLRVGLHYNEAVILQKVHRHLFPCLELSGEAANSAKGHRNTTTE